ncbi:MAG: LamG domain-containing protein, partial [Anaerolineales bacterium]|nr:LamG domain-containing protein [Anaerolineales bacterium]
SNLRKFDSENWSLYINQSQNASDGLTPGKYTYYASAKDTNNNENLTQIWEITVNDLTTPNISYAPQTPNDYDKINSDNIYVNVTASETHLENMSYYLYNESLNITGLVGYWPMDRNTTVNDTSYVVDVSGEGNDGTVNGSAVWNESGGKLGSAWVFDGKDDYVSTSDSASLDSSTGAGQPATVSLWVKFDGLNNKVILEKGSNSQYIIQSNSLKIFAGFAGGFRDTVTTFNDGDWHLFSMTYNGSHTRLYADGVLDQAAFSETRAADNNFPLVIGARDGGTAAFNGSIDEVMIFNRTLSTKEISALYNRSSINHTTFATETLNINWTGLIDGNYHYF